MPATYNMKSHFFERLSINSLRRIPLLVTCLVGASILPVQADLAEGLVGYWGMNNTLEDGVADSHGTLMGGGENANFTAGKIGQALSLNGDGEFVEINPDNEPKFDGFDNEGNQTGLTVSAWFQVGAFDKSWQALVSKGEGQNWRMHRRGDTSTVTGNGGSDDVSEGVIAVDDGEWHQIVLVSTPDVGVEAYIDGMLDGSSGAPALADDDLPLLIGENPGARNRTWNGLIDEVAFWNRPLTTEEVAELWNGGDGFDLGEGLGLSEDTDGDGMPNIYEINNGLDPNSDDSEGDLDEDGLTNKYEFDNGLFPNDADTDNDGYSDGVETGTGVWVSVSDTGTQPNNRDTDGDTLRDGVENPDLPYVNVTQPGTSPLLQDSDADGVRDHIELDQGSDPTDPNSLPGVDLSEGLVGYWPLDEDLDDYSGNDSHGELQGGDSPNFEGGRAGGALLLDGIGEWVVINPDNEPLYDGLEETPDGDPEQTGMTVSTWFRVNSFDVNWQALVAKGEGNNWRIHRREGTSGVSGNGGNADVSQGSIAVDDGEWHHLALVSTPEVGVELFVDGQLEGSSGPPNLEDNDQPMMIGENPDATGRYWNGLVDDLAFWSRPLAENEVTAIYEAGLSGTSIGDIINGPAGALPIVGWAVDDGNVSLDFITSNVNAEHGLESSTDLLAWTPVEGAMAELLGEDTIRLTATRAGDLTTFYRGAVLGVPPIYQTDFESGEEGWTATVLQGETAWELGTPAVEGLMAAHSGENAWGTDLDGPYGNGTAASLRSPVIDLTGASRPKVSFWYYVDATEDAEGVQIKYLDASGDVELFVSQDILWGTSEGWVEFRQTVPTAAREQQIIMEFTLLTDNSEPNGAGFYLDDFLIED